GGRHVDHRRRHGVAGLGLVTPVAGQGAGGAEGRLQLTGDDVVPLLLGHVHEHAVAEDAGVVDQAVDLAVGVDGGVEQGLGTGHRPDVVRPGHRLPAGRHDLVDDGLGDGRVGPRAVGLAADVVHDHPAALGGDAAGV